MHPVDSSVSRLLLKTKDIWVVGKLRERKLIVKFYYKKSIILFSGFVAIYFVIDRNNLGNIDK